MIYDLLKTDSEIFANLRIYEQSIVIGNSEIKRSKTH
jgi:hypothetical protein